MTTELKYLGDWLIPVQQGYAVTYGVAAEHARMRGGGGSLIGRPTRKTPLVTASFLLRDAAMIAWWETFWRQSLKQGGERITVPLYVFGDVRASVCTILSEPIFSIYRAQAALVTLQLSVEITDADHYSSLLIAELGSDWLVDLDSLDQLTNEDLPETMDGPP